MCNDCYKYISATMLTSLNDTSTILKKKKKKRVYPGVSFTAFSRTRAIAYM